MLTVKTIDAQAGGGPLRLIADGFPSARGKTMAEKSEWLRRHADHLRRSLMLEPRGHRDFNDTGGYSPMSGHGIVAATMMALERRLVMPGGEGRILVFDTTAGTIRAQARGDRRRVAFTNVPSFVAHGGLAVKAAGRQIRVDVAYGGTIFGCSQVHRSPGGTGTAAVLAVLDAMGLVAEDRPFVHEGLIDTRFTGRVVSRTTVGEYNAIVAEIEGAAWITGEHTFLIEDDDPLARGVLV